MERRGPRRRRSCRIHRTQPHGLVDGKKATKGTAMKSSVVLLAFAAIAGVLLTGCLSRPPTINARHFVLAPNSTNESAPAAAKHLSVGIGFVKMPAYLLAKTIAVRNGADEFAYLDDA